MSNLFGCSFLFIFIFLLEKDIYIMKIKLDKDQWLIIGEIGTAIVALGLIVASFVVPPMGIIDPSVLQAVGEILVFPVIWMIPDAIRAGKTIKYKDFEIKTPKDDTDEN